MARRLKGRAEKLLLLLMAGAVTLSLRVAFLESSSSSQQASGRGISNGVASPLQLHLDNFLQGNQTRGNAAPPDYSSTLIPPQDPSEPYPIVVLPYNGSVDPFYNVPSDGTNLWDEDLTIPAWMKAYFNWHKHKRQRLDPARWADERWMVMQCLASQDGKRCGGTSDRLKPIPTLLRIAYEHHRVFIIRWTKPATLETYLVPPMGGFDWRAPNWLAEILEDETVGRRFVPSKVIRKYAPTNLTVLRTRYQSDTAGKDLYNAARYDETVEPIFDEVFGSVWRIFFRPAPEVASILESQLHSKELVPGHYVAAHLRALYHTEDRPPDHIERLTRQSLNCASMLRPGAPIFFASDSADASVAAHRYATRKQARLVTHTPDPNPPLHIDRDKDWKTRPASAFYDTFIDLYLIALAGCVSFSEGGYGHWGLLIGGNYSCHIDAQPKGRNGKFKHECHWTSGDSDPIIPERDVRLFPDPMP